MGRLLKRRDKRRKHHLHHHHAFRSHWTIQTVIPGTVAPVLRDATPATLAAVLGTANTGDIIELGSGTYSGTWQVSAANLTIQNKAGAKPVIDSGLVLNASGIKIRGIEILNSAWTARDSANIDALPFGVEVTAQAPNAKVQNCLIHDTDTGVIIAADGAEVTGNLFYNIGATAYEHDVYTNNVTTPSVIRDNIFGATYSTWGFQAWAESGGQTNHLTIQGNVSVWEKMVVFAQGIVSHDVTVTENEGYKSHIKVGQASQNNEDVNVTNNYIVYARDALGVLDMERWNVPTVTGNTFIGGDTDALIKHVPATGNPMAYDRNTYILTNPDTTQFANVDGTLVDFAGWQAIDAHPDANSTFSATLPTVNRIVMRQNPVDAERAWVVVYNWENSASVSLDLSSLSLSNGTQYILRQAQDPKGDTQTFTYDGSAVSMSMAAVDHSVATPTGAEAAIVASTFPAFGCWLLERA